VTNGEAIERLKTAASLVSSARDACLIAAALLETDTTRGCWLRDDVAATLANLRAGITANVASLQGE
jgi:hypothetical protein